MTASNKPKRSRLTESAYNSPYTRAGAQPPHALKDPYADRRSKALATLEAMGYDPLTMVEREVQWAEDQDPFGHVKHAKYLEILGLAFHRVMEGYDEFLSEEEYDDMVHSRSIAPVIRNFGLNIYRQVKYPDSLIAAFRQDRCERDRNVGNTCLFSLSQQAIVADVSGAAVYIDMKTGRRVDITKAGGNWPKLQAALSAKSDKANRLREAWEAENPRAGKRAKL